MNPLRRDDPSDIVAIRRVVEKLKGRLSSTFNNLEDEWRMYQLDEGEVPNLIKVYAAAITDKPQTYSAEVEGEDSDDDTSCTAEPSIAGNVPEGRVDNFWSKVFELRDVAGNRRYPTLRKLVMASLVIAHGNADVERGLSDNKRVVSKDRTKLSLSSIVSIRATQDAVRFHDPNSSNAANIPITRQLLVAVRNPHAAYTARLEKKKADREAKRRAKDPADDARKDEQARQIAKKRALQEQDEELVKNQHNAQNVLKAGEALLADGNEKLTSALRAKDFQMASVAQAIIEAGQKKCKTAREQLETIESKKKYVNRKRKELVAVASAPPSKKHKQEFDSR